MTGSRGVTDPPVRSRSKNTSTGPDGVARVTEVEDELNKLFASVFRGRSAHKVLDHLKSITIGQVAGPEIETGHLFHMEGRRFLYYVIDQRIERGKHGNRK